MRLVTIPIAAALFAPAGVARAGEGENPHATIVLAAGLEGRGASGDGVRASSFGGSARLLAAMNQTQDDGAVFHFRAFGELGSIGSELAGATGLDFGIGVKVPLAGAWGGFFRLGTQAQYASDRVATLAWLTFPRLEIGGLYTSKRVHVDATARIGLTAGSFTPAIVAAPSPSLPSFATETHRNLGPLVWGAAMRALTPYGHLEATWSRFEPTSKKLGRVDVLEGRACAGYWVVICGDAGLARGPVLVPFRGYHDAELVTFGISLGIGRELDATTGVFPEPAPRDAEQGR